MPDKPNVIAFTPRPLHSDAAQVAKVGTGPAPRKCRAHPVTSLSMAMRSASPELRPETVAADLLAAQSNALALPLWNERRASFRKHLANLRVSPADLIQLASEYRAAARAEGIAQKAARRQGESAAFRAFDEMTLGPDRA